MGLHAALTPTIPPTPVFPPAGKGGDHRRSGLLSENYRTKSTPRVKDKLSRTNPWNRKKKIKKISEVYHGIIKKDPV